MKQKNIIPTPLYIANIIVTCLMAIVLCYFIQYPSQYDNLFYSMLSAVIFAVIFFWKPFLVLILVVSGTGLVYVIRNRDKGISRIRSEVILSTFGVAVAMSLGFVLSSTTKSGKPNIEPSTFFPYFSIALLSYIILRVGIGVLVTIRKRLKG